MSISGSFALFFLLVLLSTTVRGQIPVITSFSPASGPVGTTVLISGSNFSASPSANIVYFGGVRAFVSAASLTSLSATVPAGTTYQPITITTNNLTAYSSKAFITTFPGGGLAFTPNSFAAKIDSTTGLNANGMVIVDLDGDGKPDLAMPDNSNSPVSGISVHRNTSTSGAISFAAVLSFATPIGSLPYSIAAGDIDGDGKPDLVVTNVGASTVSVFRNTSTPGLISFASRVDFPTGEEPFSVAIGDLDGDGKPDLVVADFLSSTLSLLKNTSTPGSISMAAKTDLQTGLAPGTVVIGDLDGDGKPEMAVTNTLSSSISVFRNQSSPGTMAFAAKADFAIGGDEPAGLAIGDLDGDGKPELVTTYDNFNQTFEASVSFSVLRNTATPGNISFAPRIDYSSGNAFHVSIGDLNGDGKPEIIAATSSQQVSVYRNTCTPGSISLAAAVNYTTSLPNTAVAGDLDGDNLPDLAVANFNSDLVTLLKNQVFAPAITSFSPADAIAGTTVTITGFNFPGANSVSFGGVPASSFIVVSSTTITAIVGNGASGAVSVTTPQGIAVLDGFAFFFPPSVSSFTPDSAGKGTTVTIKGAHLTGTTAVSFGGEPAGSFSIPSDSLIMAVVGNGASGDVSITTPGGTASLAGFIFIPAPVILSFAPTSAGQGDTITISGANLSGATAVNFGGTSAASYTLINSTTILAVIGAGSSGTVQITNPGGIATLSGFSFIYPPPPVVTSFSPDSGTIGTTVIISGTGFDSAAANNIVYFGGVRGSIISSTPTAISVTVPAGADYQPISVTTLGHHLTGYSAKPFRVTFSGGTIQFLGHVDYTGGVFSGHVTVGDLDNDGKPDVVLSTVGGISNAIFVFRNSSSPGIITLSAGVQYGNAAYESAVALADLDGDGRLDIVLLNSGSVLTLFRNTSSSGNISFAPPVQIPSGSGPAGLAIADLDGDGKPDLITANQLTNSFSVLRNTSIPGSFSFAVKADYPAGYIPTGVAVGDFDGDGKMDIAVCAVDNTVSIRRNNSTPGNLQFGNAIQFITGPNPSGIVAGDLDGDGKPDLAMSNYDNNAVSILKNTSVSGGISFAAVQQYGNSFIVPSQPSGIAIADVNGDGKPDLAFTNMLYVGSVSVFENNSDPGNINFNYVPDPYFITPSNPQGIFMADLDGDGRPDIATANGGLSILRNQTGEEPFIYSFSPATGISGDTITITGKNFTGTGTVNFGETPAGSFIVVSPTVIKAVLGTGSSGDISVSTPKGTATWGGFIYAAPPVVNFFTPVNATTGTTVTIVGDNFIGATAVSFGGVPATSFTVVSTHSITAVVDVGATGYVRVINPYGADSLSGFTYLRVPTITSFTPAGGATGTTITLTGTNFIGASAVRFGGVDAASFTVVSPTTITAVVGAGASGLITVTTDNWTGYIDGFVFNPPPTITFTGDTVFCQGGNITLTSSASTNNQWYKDGASISGATQNTLLVTSSGAYTVTTSYSGTVSGISRPVTITVLTTPSKPTVKWDSNLGMVSSADTGNQWYTETMTAIPGATGPGYKPSGPGFFYLRVTQNGCSSPFSDKYQYVITATVNLGGPDKYLRVAPNPVTSLLYINFNYPGITTLMAELTDLRGNQLLTEPDLRNGDKMDLSGIARGVYFLKLFSQNGRISVMTPILKL